MFGKRAGGQLVTRTSNLLGVRVLSVSRLILSVVLFESGDLSLGGALLLRRYSSAESEVPRPPVLPPSSQLGMQGITRARITGSLEAEALNIEEEER